MSENNNVKNTIDYKFCSEVSLDSPHWTLAKYFQLLGSDRSKEKILSALYVYWQPMAAQYQGEDLCSLKQSVIDCIYWLQWQIHCWKLQKFKLLSSRCLTKELGTQETISLELRCQVNSDSRYWQLFNYFQSRQNTFMEEDMIFRSSTAYWHPLAAFHLGLCNCEDDWRELVSQSVKLIEQHIKYLQITFDVDKSLLAIRDPNQIESLSDNLISLSDREIQTQTALPDAQTAPRITQNSVQAESTPPEPEPESIQANQQINWMEQIDDPALKPRESDAWIAQMFDSIGRE